MYNQSDEDEELDQLASDEEEEDEDDLDDEEIEDEEEDAGTQLERIGEPDAPRGD